MYLECFELPGVIWEERFLQGDIKTKRTCYSSVYPFQVFPNKQLTELEFSPITVFYGGNGSGKTTLLNVIAETCKIERGTLYNRSAFFDDYIEHCEFWTPRYSPSIPSESRVITSDDVFDYLLNIRCLNEKIDTKREELLEEYVEVKYSSFQMQSMADYQKLKQHNDTKSKSGSQYVNGRLMNNVTEQSNGESAFFYFTENIKENALYLLDEPENSLAVRLQMKLQKFLEDSVRFFHCQFIIATHSPFLLSMENATIYDLDAEPATIKNWTELENVRLYYDFFKSHKGEFE